MVLCRKLHFDLKSQCLKSQCQARDEKWGYPWDGHALPILINILGWATFLRQSRCIGEQRARSVWWSAASIHQASRPTGRDRRSQEFEVETNATQMDCRYNYSDSCYRRSSRWQYPRCEAQSTNNCRQAGFVDHAVTSLLSLSAVQALLYFTKRKSAVFGGFE